MKGNQRWRDRKSVFRRPDEQIRTADYDVAELLDDNTAKAFVCRHHYSRSYPAARWRFGLFHQGELAGVAVFSHPVSNRVLTNVFDGSPLDSVELGRFVLLDDVPGNGETYFLWACLRRLKKLGLVGVVAFSDPQARTNVQGEMVLPGHIGTIYQAGNSVYLGRGTPRTLRILPDGTVFSDRAIQKIRSLDQGWQYSVEKLVRFGATRLHDDPFDTPDSRGWLREWLPKLTRKLRHQGNHKYAWWLHEPEKRKFSLPYPKTALAVAR